MGYCVIFLYFIKKVPLDPSLNRLSGGSQGFISTKQPKESCLDLASPE